MSPNPPFEDYAGTTQQVHQQAPTQTSIAIAQPSTQAVTTPSGQDVSYIVRQIDEAMVEAAAHVSVGEARLQENNILEAIREFELARELVERDIDPALQYVQQVPKVQGGMNILSDYQIQSMQTQRQAILARITMSYDFQTLYQRQSNQDRVNTLREQSKPVFKPLVIEPGQGSLHSIDSIEISQAHRDNGNVIIDGLFEVPIEDVKWHIKKFQQHQSAFSTYLLRTQQYYPIVSSILSSHGMPERLAYVGLVASGYQPTVKDAATGKVGLWQLSADVARRYGLQVNSKKDERKDIEASTTAFARYLRDLEQRFGSWDLAIMAYDMGEQELQRTINQAGVYDANKIRQYVGQSSPEGAFLPKLAAAILIAGDPEAFGFGSVSMSQTTGAGTSSRLVPVNAELGEPPVTTILNQ